METKLYKWFEDQRNKHVPINGVEMKAMALKLFAQIYPDKPSSDFVASDGWFTKFKHRHGIRLKKICGEILSSDKTMITPFILKLHAKIDEMGITNAQLYNADESGLFYRLLPNTTYVTACEKTAPGRKIRKERVSFMLCSNADGSHKVTPFVIGKSKEPRCFKGFQNPLVYDHSAKAWMTSRIFINWFLNSFIKEVKQFSAENNLPPKALLLLDNCSAHSPIDSLRTEDGNIQAMLLPPNVAALIQPMDQNPIKIVKLKYRNMLISNIIAQDDVHDALQNHDLKNTILLLKSAWDALPISIIEKSWTKILNWDDGDFDDEDNVPLAVLANQTETDPYRDEMDETLQLLSKLAPNCVLPIDEIENWNADVFDETDIEGIDSNSEEEDGAFRNSVPVSYTDAINAANMLIKWSEQNAELTAKHMSNLLKLRSDILNKQILKPPKQTKLTTFFTQSNV